MFAVTDATNTTDAQQQANFEQPLPSGLVTLLLTYCQCHTLLTFVPIKDKGTSVPTTYMRCVSKKKLHPFNFCSNFVGHKPI